MDGSAVDLGIDERPPPAGDTDAPMDGTGAAATRRGVDRGVVAALIVAVGVVECVLHGTVTKPLWYDELWRAHYLSVPAGQFWTQIAHANSPSAAGWLAVTRAAAALGGWHAWVLRMPEVVTFPLLAAGTYLLARRFTEPLPATVAAAVIGLNGTVLDLGIQLKPYSVEAITSVAAVLLWLGAPPAGTGHDRARTIRLTLAGALGLFSVPMALLLIPLVASDLLTTDARARLRSAATALPALLIVTLHTGIFVARQSGQRSGAFWDGQFLAGRGLTGSVRFVGTQIWRVAGGLPTGIDRIDPNLVHSPTDATYVSQWIIAPLVVLAWILGGRVLLRRRDGRVLVGALGGAELIELVASADRFWPFGAARPNLFLVPLLVVVTATGVVEVARLARLRGPAGLVAGLVVVALLGWATAATTVRLWDNTHRDRLYDRMVDAALATRAAFRPGDVIVVGGRLAPPGWTYAMGSSADGPSIRAPRVPASDTIFLQSVGAGRSAGALAARPVRPAAVLLFVSYDNLSGRSGELAALRGAGWCPARTSTFPQTGTLTVLGACP